MPCAEKEVELQSILKGPFCLNAGYPFRQDGKTQPEDFLS
jgi:hypothetical protein